MRDGWRTVLLVAVVAASGAAGTLIVGAVMGMDTPSLADLLLSLLVAMLVTVFAAVMARPLLRRTSFRQRFVALPLVAAGADVAADAAASGPKATGPVSIARAPRRLPMPTAAHTISSRRKRASAPRRRLW